MCLSLDYLWQDWLLAQRRSAQQERHSPPTNPQPGLLPPPVAAAGHSDGNRFNEVETVQSVKKVRSKKERNVAAVSA